VAGVAVLGFGALLLLDAEEVLSLDFALLGPLACLAIGAILLTSGLTRDD
jgi:hypothetical protein